MRPYTGFNGDSGRTLPGLAALVAYLENVTNKGLWNNGTYVNRPMRGRASTSVHATGRAADLSWRKQTHRGFGAYNPAKAVIDVLVDNADVLYLDIVLDYYGPPHGQGWRCDRNSWVQYERPTIGGAPGGDWFHIEIAPRMAQSADYYNQVLAQLPFPTTPTTTAPKYPGRVTRRGSRGQTVTAIQQRLTDLGFTPGPVDGQFGPITDAAVRAFQTAQGLTVDGLVGPKTWAALYNS